MWRSKPTPEPERITFVTLELLRQFEKDIMMLRSDFAALASRLDASIATIPSVVASAVTQSEQTKDVDYQDALTAMTTRADALDAALKAATAVTTATAPTPVADPTLVDPAPNATQ